MNSVVLSAVRRPLLFLQDNNAIVREFGSPRGTSGDEKLYNHVDLVTLLDIVNLEAGAAVAGAPAARFSSIRQQPLASSYLCVRSRAAAAATGLWYAASGTAS
jgi:hypothetical protein